MFESTKVAEEICKKLLRSSCLDVRNLRVDEVPKHKGIYLWRKKDVEKIVYVGTALGKRGLRQRIITQHLNPNYRKSRAEESSVLRKAIVEQEHVLPCKGCVDWMKENLLLSFWPREEAEVIKDVIFSLAEKILIAEEQPPYNKEWKSVQEQRARKRRTTT